MNQHNDLGSQQVCYNYSIVGPVIFLFSLHPSDSIGFCRAGRESDIVWVCLREPSALNAICGRLAPGDFPGIGLDGTTRKYQKATKVYGHDGVSYLSIGDTFVHLTSPNTEAQIANIQTFIRKHVFLFDFKEVFVL